MEQSQRDFEDELDQEDDESYDPEDEIPEFNFEDLDENSDRDIVRAGILEKYGFVPSNDYVDDLIAFVMQLTKGSESGS